MVRGTCIVSYRWYFSLIWVVYTSHSSPMAVVMMTMVVAIWAVSERGLTCVHFDFKNKDMTILLGVYILLHFYWRPWLGQKIPSVIGGDVIPVTGLWEMAGSWQHHIWSRRKEWDVRLEGTVRGNVSVSPVQCAWTSRCSENALSGILTGWVESCVLVLLLREAAALCTPVLSCSSGVKCRDGMSDPRAAFAYDFYLNVADLSCWDVVLS